MKQLILKFFTILSLLFFNSCELPDSFYESRQYGISFEIINQTDQEYENTRVIIGGIDENNEFIMIDSYNLPKIEKGLQYVLGGFDNNRWKPDFDKIKEIGEGKAYFKFQFEGKDIQFLEYLNDNSQYLYIDLNKFEVRDDYGNLKIYIENESTFDINGDMVSANNYAMGLSQRDDI